MDAETSLTINFYRAKLKRYANEVIDGLKELGRDDGMMSPADSGLNNFWEEWLVQVHGEQSMFYEVYEDLVRSFVTAVIEKLPEDEVGLIWLRSEASCEYLDNLEDDTDIEKPSLFDMRNGAEEQLFDMVLEIASEMELPANVDEYLLGGGEI